jgi:uncharacterized protein (TIGR03067 family)
VPVDSSKGDANRDERKQLDGTWVVESIVRDPRERGSGEGKNLRINIKGEKVVVKAPSDENPLGGLIIKLDPTKKPKSLDYWPDETPFGKSSEDILQEPPVLGIYERNGDTLRVCWAPLENRKRPTEFASKVGSGHSLLVLKRILGQPEARSREASWVADASPAEIPDRPAVGRLHGEPFALGRATAQPNHAESGNVGDPPEKLDKVDGTTLTLQRRGKQPGELGTFTVFAAVKPGETVDGKTFLLPPGGLFNQPGKIPDKDGKGFFYAVAGVQAASKGQDGKPRFDVMPKATLRLVFGKRRGNVLPGKIYLCLDDGDKSFVAGTFEAEIRD